MFHTESFWTFPSRWQRTIKVFLFFSNTLPCESVLSWIQYAVFLNRKISQCNQYILLTWLKIVLWSFLLSLSRIANRFLTGYFYPKSLNMRQIWINISWWGITQWNTKGIVFQLLRFTSCSHSVGHLNNRCWYLPALAELKCQSWFHPGHQLFFTFTLAPCAGNQDMQHSPEHYSRCGGEKVI